MYKLSICIPIYNRYFYLDKILAVFLKDKEKFVNDVHLFISDNCSTDDISGLCEKYSSCGLPMEYHRNASNLGMDGNFITCFQHSKGQYTFLLGSDDIPTDDFLEQILQVLDKFDLGLLHLKESNTTVPAYIYNSPGDFLSEIHVWITYLSGNIVNSTAINKTNLEKYKGTFISQVPVYLEGVFLGKDNGILQGKFYRGDNDSKNNGGYNLFQVFCENLLTIIHEKVDEGKLTEKQFKGIKKSIFCKWMIGFYVRFFINHDYGRFKMDNAKEILHKWYGGESYYYIAIVKQWMKKFIIARFNKNHGFFL